MSKTTHTMLMGYRVEKLAEDPSTRVQLAYRLHGPRGAVWGLMRNEKRPHLLFAINGRTGFVGAVKGNS